MRSIIVFASLVMVVRVGARRVLGYHHHLDAVGLQRFLDVLGYARFVAGRIGAIDLNQRLEMAHGFVVDFRPIGCLSADRQRRN